MDKENGVGKTARKTSIYDVAARAGVSPSTVSRVINNDPRIAAATAGRVRQAVREAGYEPRPTSQRPGARRSERRARRYNQIALLYGMVSEALSSSVYAEVVQGLADTARLQGVNLILSRCADLADSTGVPDKIDGAILFGLNAQGALLKRLRAMAAVRVMGLIVEEDGFDHVSYDNVKIGVLAARYLAAAGCQRFFTPYIDESNPLIRQRVDSFSAELARLGFSCYFFSEDISRKDEGGAIGYDAGRCGLFSPDDSRLVRIVPQFVRAGYEPGRGLVIAGCNNNRSLLDSICPGIASVDINCRRVGEEAVTQLLKKIAAPGEFRQKIIIEPVLAVAASGSE